MKQRTKIQQKKIMQQQAGSLKREIKLTHLAGFTKEKRGKTQTNSEMKVEKLQQTPQKYKGL